MDAQEPLGLVADLRTGGDLDPLISEYVEPAACLRHVGPGDAAFALEPGERRGTLEPGAPPRCH